MSDLKTRPTESSVVEFLDAVQDEAKRADAYRLLDLMKEITGEEPKMWGPSIVGFGSYHFKYASGREGDWMLTGFSPRKTALTLYIMSGFRRHDELMKHLGRFKTGKSCLYIKHLEDVDMDVLADLISSSVDHVRTSNS